MLEQLLTDARVFPTLVIDDPDAAVPLAQALYDGGIRLLEVTLRTPAAAEAIVRIRAAAIPLSVAAGTLRTPADVATARAAGAVFGVSPGATQPLIDAVRALAWPWLPGAATASEAMHLRAAGFTIQKLFPASLALLDAFAGPLPDLKWVPTGGVDEDNARDYLMRANVLAVSGSWIAPRSLVAHRDFVGIQRRAAQAVAVARGAGDCV
jgi:2-dehydro-3-deoxyphosphogluconate aldolase/(4S)-4-hydroxy-2-oxoglutarate aldolase